MGTIIISLFVSVRVLNGTVVKVSGRLVSSKKTGYDVLVMIDALPRLNVVYKTSELYSLGDIPAAAQPEL